MIIRRFRKEAVLAGLAAKAQAPVVVTDKAKLSPTVGTAVFQLVHGATSDLAAMVRSGRRRILPSEQPHQDHALAQQPGIAFRLLDRERALPRDFGWINSSQYLA